MTLGGTAVASRSAFLKNDGSIVGDDGVSEVPFDVPQGQYYLVIKHRNHLPVMSKITVTLNTYPNAASLYNFTDTQDRAHGTNPMKDLGDGKFGMIAGDANGNGSINTEDRTQVWDKRNFTGYLPEDVNLDGQVNASDRMFIWNNRVNSTQVP